MDYRYTYTVSLRSSWCRRNWTLYPRRDGIKGCTFPSLLLSPLKHTLKPITTQNITLRIYDPLHIPTMFFPPSPFSFPLFHHKHTHAHIKHNIHNRPLHHLLLIHLETPTSPPRSLPPRNGKLPRNARYGRSCQLAFVLPHHLGVDQGNRFSLCLFPSSACCFNVNDEKRRAGSTKAPETRYTFSAGTQVRRYVPS